MSNVKSKEAVKVEAGVKEGDAAGELAKVGTAVTGIAAVLIGTWGLVCVVAATLSEGPINLVKGLFGSMQ